MLLRYLCRPKRRLLPFFSGSAQTFGDVFSVPLSTEKDPRDSLVDKHYSLRRRPVKTSKLDVIDYYENEVQKSHLASLDRKKFLLSKKKNSLYQKYQIYCPFTTISSTEEQENWERFLLKKENGDTLTIDEYNMILKTMRTIEGVENVLDEISNLLYIRIYNWV